MVITGFLALHPSTYSLAFHITFSFNSLMSSPSAAAAAAEAAALFRSVKQALATSFIGFAIATTSVLGVYITEEGILISLRQPI
jgi:hypothetical protein